MVVKLENLFGENIFYHWNKKETTSKWMLTHLNAPFMYDAALSASSLAKNLKTS
jgi:hypothetical protein